MKPFRISNPLKGITRTYPNLKSIKCIIHSGGITGIESFIKLWLSEGIPYAFKKCPALYESVRSWLSSSIGIHAKEISITGSSRLGISLAPNKLGKKLDENSDLDIFIVSNSLFEKLRNEFLKWSCDYEDGTIKPKNDREVNFWEENNTLGHKLLLRGFIDQKLIPNYERYPNNKSISQIMYLLIGKLKITQKGLHFKRASIRCYRDWDSYVRQLTINLSAIKNTI